MKFRTCTFVRRDDVSKTVMEVELRNMCRAFQWEYKGENRLRYVLYIDRSVSHENED